MPENFNSVPENKIDISHIRNYLIAEENRRTRKALPFSIQLLFALAAAICIYLAMDGLNLGLPFILPFSGICLGPVLCVYINLFSPIILKLCAAFIPLGGFALRAFLTGITKDYPAVASSLFMYLLCMLVAIILVKTALSAYTKNSCFLLITGAYLLVIAGLFVTLLIHKHGYFDLALAVRTIDGFFTTLEAEMLKMFSTEQFVSSLGKTIPALEYLDIEDILASLRETTPAFISAVKSLLPAIIAVTCMVFSFLTVELFTVFAKKLKIDVFVCIMDDFWTYRPTRVTTVVYDIIFFAYIISMFAPFPAHIAAAIDNMFLLLASCLAVLGVKGIYSFFRRKKVRHFLCALIAFGITSGSFVILGSSSLLVLSTIGSIYVSFRDKEEKMLLPMRLLYIRAEFDRRYGENSDNPEN